MNVSAQDNDSIPHKLGLANRLFWDLFEIDVRSLAILRISLGVLILVDLASRLRNLELFYTEGGIVTRALSQEYLGSGFWSLYWIDGSLAVTQVLFALTASAAVGLIFGFNTRLMTILCLVLVASLHVRNPLVLTGGHILMRLMLFWSIFLPLGAVWSVDAHLSPNREPDQWRVASVATMAIMLQVAFIYLFSGISKLNSYWISGHAVEYVLGLEMYVKPLGNFLRGFPGLLRAISIMTVSLEIIAPILMFVPRINKFTRGMAMGLFWWMHIAIWSTMSIGIFSLMAMVSWFVFVPSQAWNFYFTIPRDSKFEYEWDFTPGRILVETLCGLALVLVIALNLANINPAQTWFPQSLRTLANRTLLVQEFKLFGNPPFTSPAIEYQAKTVSGDNIDLFLQMMHEPGNPPESTYEYLATQHWRRVHSNLMTAPDEPIPPTVAKMRERVLEGLVEKWNNTHDPARYIVDATLSCYYREIQLNNAPGESKKQVWAHWTKSDNLQPVTPGKVAVSDPDPGSGLISGHVSDPVSESVSDPVSESVSDPISDHASDPVSDSGQQSDALADSGALTFRKVTGDEEVRGWEDVQGRKMEARYTGTTIDEQGKVFVLFEKESGKTYSFPLERLSERDQRYIRE